MSPEVRDRRLRRLRIEVTLSAMGAVVAGTAAIVALFVGPQWAVAAFAAEDLGFLILTLSFARLLRGG